VTKVFSSHKRLVPSVISDVKAEWWNRIESWTWRIYVRVIHPILFNSIFLLKSFMQSSYVVAHSWDLFTTRIPTQVTWFE